MGMGGPQGRRNRCVNMAHHEPEPWGSVANVAKAPSESLELWYAEFFAPVVPMSLEDGDCGANVLQGGLDGHGSRVDDLAQNQVSKCNRHLLHFLKGYGVLAKVQVGLAQEDENCLNAGSNGLFNAFSVKQLGVEVVIDIKCVWRVFRYAILVHHSRVLGAPASGGVFGLPAAQGWVPLEAVEVFSVLGTQGLVLEEGVG